MLSATSAGPLRAEAAAVSDRSLAAAWADNTRRYRVPVTFSANGFERLDKPAELEINFTSLLQTIGENGAFAAASIRVVEVDSTGQILNEAVPFQFNPAANFDAASNAAGELILLMDGQTGSSSVRDYYVYFDTVDQGPFTPASVTPLVYTTDNVQDAGFQSFKIETVKGTYYYHKTGGGFSSLDDAGNNDWISYSTASGSAGDFRGIPNMVHPRDGGHFHPGRTTVTSTLLHQGPLKSTFTSQTPDGNWQVMWEVYPTYAQLSVLRAANRYWFLYEGTPGGSLDLNNDLVTRSDGTQTTAATRWTGDIPGEEWVFFTDPALQRSLFLVHHEDDTLVDSYYEMNEQMTVFGFGRSGNSRSLSGTGNHLTIGLVDETALASVALRVNDAYQPLGITVGAAEAGPDEPGPTNTPTNTPAPTNTPTPTNTPENTVTPTFTPTPSNTPVNTPTNTPTSTPTNTPTQTPTSTPTNTPTFTPTSEPSTCDPDAGNVLLNPGVEDGMAHWRFYTSGQGSFTISSDAYQCEQAALLTFTDVDRNMQFFQDDFLLQGNTRYRLSFAAKSSTGHDVTVRVHRHSSPYTNYGLDQQFDVSEAWQRFSTEFTTTNISGSTEDTRLRFWFVGSAQDGDLYWIDDVILEPVSDEEPTETPTNTPMPTNTPTPTNTPVNTPTNTPTSMPTNTPTQTPTSIPTNTPTPTNTPVNTPTNTPTSTPTNTPTLTPTSEPSTCDPDAGNVLLNPGFEDGMAHWRFYTSGQGSFTISSDAYQCEQAALLNFISINRNMQFYQDDFLLQGNTRYRLSFAAKSSTGHDVTVRVHRHSSPYTNYGLDQQFDVSEAWQRFSIEFATTNISGSTEDTRLRFWFVGSAQNGDQYWIDDVILEEVN